MDRVRRVTRLGAGAGLGAALMWFFDPRMGRTRRAKLADQAKARVRRGGDQAVRKGRFAAGKAKGAVWETAFGDRPPENDPTLAHKIESELLGGGRFPKERINVSAQDGTVVLKGQVDRPEQAQELEAEIRQVPGVRDVVNHLHV